MYHFCFSFFFDCFVLLPNQIQDCRGPVAKPVSPWKSCKDVEKVHPKLVPKIELSLSSTVQDVNISNMQALEILVTKKVPEALLAGVIRHEAQTSKAAGAGSALRLCFFWISLQAK